jgi:hypothetical protein
MSKHGMTAHFLFDRMVSFNRKPAALHDRCMSFHSFIHSFIIHSVNPIHTRSINLQDIEFVMIQIL